MKMLALLALLAGCASMMGCQSVPSLSAEQLAAMPEGSTFCAQGTGMWGAVKVTYAKLTQGTTEGGNVVLDSNSCGVTIVSNPAVVAAAQAAAAAARATKQ